MSKKDLIISVIIPAFNCEKTIERALSSVHEAVAFAGKSKTSLTAEVVVVNDISPDNTAAIVSRHVVKHPSVYLIHHSENLGAGPARNTGVRHSKGDLLFFLDADDIFFTSHILDCINALERYPQAHFVKTKIHIDETIHPYWQDAIENSVPINICIRRWCHDFIGGFYEGHDIKITGGEDALYRDLMRRFLVGLVIEKKTLQHFRYSGNHMDRKMKMFQAPPTETIDVLNADEKRLMPVIEQLHAAKVKQMNRQIAFWQKKCPRVVTLDGNNLSAE